MIIRFKKSFIMSLILIVCLANAGTSWAATAVLDKLVHSKSEVSLEVGATAILTTTAVYDDFTKKDVTIYTNWEIENKDDSIATIYNGTITGKKEGTITAIASYDGKKEAVKVTVTKKVKSLTKSVQSLDLRKGESEPIKVEATYADTAVAEDVTNKADWSSSNNEVATVVNGTVKALSAGVTTIRASYGNQVITVEVNVEIVKRLDLDVNTVSLLVNNPKDPKDSQKVTLTATYPDGDTEVVTEDAQWSTSNEKVADVLKGTITAYGPGTATITASYGTKTITIEVDVDKTRKLVVNKQNVFLSVFDGAKSKETLTLEAIFPDNTTPVDVTSLATWTTSNTAVAYVNKGVVYAEGTGSATITGKYGDKSVTVQVDVDVPRHLDLVEKVGMSIGESKQLELNAAFSDVIVNKNVADKAVWTSSDAAVAYVSNGKITAYKMGEATITATYGGLSATTKVSVDIPTSISLDTKVLDIKVENPYQASLVAVYDINDHSKDVVLTSKAEWSSSDEKIAEVNSDGLITGVARGSVTITALYNKTKYTMKVNVGLVKELEADSQLIILSSGESRMIELAAKDSSNLDEIITAADVTWKSSSPSIVGVKDGKVTGYSKGKSTITAEYGGEKVTVSVEVDIIQSMEASHQSISLKTGGKGSKDTQISVTVKFSDGSTKDVTSLAEWKTSSYKVATVNKGKVTAVAYGKTNVIVKYAGKSISIPLDVDSLKYLQTDEVSLKLKAGDQIQVNATATYADGSEDDVSKAALWTSSRILTATVKDGIIKATGKGKATITVSYGGKKTKVVVVVD